MKSQIASNSKYKITIYHGGEMPEETLYAQTLEEAQRKSMRGEYSEIIDLTTNKMVYGHGGDIAKSNLDMVKSYSKEFIHHGEELQKVLKNDPEVEGWVVAKGERATTDLSDITHYLDGMSEYGAGGVVNFYSPEWIVIGKDNETQKWVIVSPKPDFVAVANKMKKAMLEGARYKKLRLQYSDFKVINEEDFDENMVFKFAKGGTMKKSKVAYIQFYGDFSEDDVDTIYDLLSEQGIEVDGSKKWHTKGYAEELQENEYTRNFDVRFHIADAENPKKLMKQLDVITSNSENIDWSLIEEYAKGGKITTNSKQVREAIKQHILENVYDENEEQFKTLDGATQYLAEEFKRVADHRNNLARYPNNQERFTDYLRGIPFNFYFYNDDIEDFLNGLGINPSGKKYTPDQMWKLYGALIWKEVSPKYSQYGQGGEVGSYNNPQNSIHVLHVDGQNWFLSKIDSTHFYISNHANVKGSAQHIGQHNGEPYYEEIRQWLKSSKFAEGGEVSKWSVSDITDAEYLGIIEIQDNQGEYHNFEIMETNDKLVFGSFINSGFIESGYIEKEDYDTDQTLVHLVDELEVYYNDGIEYCTAIVVNQRMARGGQVDKGGMIYALAEFVSSGTIANKTNYEKYDDISAIRTKAIQYYIENGDKPYSMGELERVLKMVSSQKLAKGGISDSNKRFVLEVRDGKTDELLEERVYRYNRYKDALQDAKYDEEEFLKKYGDPLHFELKEKYAKGGKLSNKATYIPKRDIAEVEVEKDGKTTYVDGANLYDGVYVKKGKFAKGGMVTKGELVWKKLSSSDKIKFLHENFTPEITPRGQEILVGKSYNFLPKNVKQALQSKYANVEEYAKGGKLSNKATYIPKRDIAEVEVEKDGKTTFVDGANLYDGVYVKKGKFAKGGSTKYLNNGEANGQYLDSLSQAKKKEILTNIAKHYEVSLEEANEEVRDSEAELLFEYIANNISLAMEIHRGMMIAVREYAQGGDVSEYPEYEKGINISKPFYVENDAGFMKSKEYRIISKLNNDTMAGFPIGQYASKTKKEALKKANAYYEHCKKAKTKEELEILGRDFAFRWSPEKESLVEPTKLQKKLTDFLLSSSDKSTENARTHLKDVVNMNFTRGYPLKEIAEEFHDQAVYILNQTKENDKAKVKAIIQKAEDMLSSSSNEYAKGGEVSTYKKANWRFW